MRLLILLFISFSLNGQIDYSRQKQLDSIVSNIDANLLRNLDSIHAIMDKAGRDNEEKVFMFYGVFAIHYKYDFDRKGDRKAKEYTPHYTAYKKKGVCRDFSALFLELCERSHIPCVEASGRVNVPPWTAVADMFKRKLRKANHAWNIVKFNDEWHLMDATWSKIDSTRKYYEQNDDGTRSYQGKLKIANREFYDLNTEAFYVKRNAVHPALYKSDEIYTYKTAKKKQSKREELYSDYNYNHVLDSLSKNKFYSVSREYIGEMRAYSRQNYINRFLFDFWNFLDVKRSKFNPITIEECDQHIAEFRNVLKFMEYEHGRKYKKQFEKHLRSVEKHKAKLSRTSSFSTRK